MPNGSTKTRLKSSASARRRWKKSPIKLARSETRRFSPWYGRNKNRPSVLRGTSEAIWTKDRLLGCPVCVTDCAKDWPAKETPLAKAIEKFNTQFEVHATSKGNQLVAAPVEEKHGGVEQFDDVFKAALPLRLRRSAESVSGVAPTVGRRQVQDISGS